MREIKGKYEDLVLRENYEGTATDDYIRVTLTDENEIPDALSRLRVVYPNIMKLDYDNKRTRGNTLIGAAENIEKKSPLELFGEFYEKQNNQPMSAEQKTFISELIEKIWEENK